MQKQRYVFHLPLLVGLKSLLFITLLSLALPTISFAASCANYYSPINSAVQNRDFDGLENLLNTLNRRRICPVSYLDGVKRSMAQIAAAKADHFTQQGQLIKASNWLKRAPIMVWQIQAVYGDIAAKQQHWQSAAQHYNQAIDLVADRQATPKAPEPSVIDMLYQLAYELQILVGNLDDVISSDGQSRGMMRGSVRGIAPKKRIIPIPFGYGQKTLGKNGKRAANRLAAYLKRRGVKKVTLIGHTDSKGRRVVNQRISKQRAKVVANHLKNQGVTATIQAIGKGEDEPLQLRNRWKLTPTQIDALNRRVEFDMK